MKEEATAMVEKVDPIPLLAALPLQYGIIFVVAIGVVFMVICYLTLLLVCSEKWIKQSVDAVPVMQVSMGITSCIVAIGGLSITPIPQVNNLLEYRPFMDESAISPIAIGLLVFGMANMFRWVLGYWVQMIAALFMFMNWSLITLLTAPVLHIRISFWVAIASLVQSGFLLTVMAMFTRNASDDR